MMSSLVKLVAKKETPEVPLSPAMNARVPIMPPFPRFGPHAAQPSDWTLKAKDALPLAGK